MKLTPRNHSLRRLPLLLALGGTLLLPLAAPAQTDPPAIDVDAVVPAPARGTAVDLLPDAADPVEVSSGTLELLQELERYHKPVETVHARFTQERTDEVFNEVIRSGGELWYFKPVLFRSDYSDPEPTINIVDKDALYMYVPELEQVDYWPFESQEERTAQLQHLLIGFEFRTADLIRRYHIRSSEDDPALLSDLPAGADRGRHAVVELIPREAIAETSPFSRLKVTIDKQSHLPEKLWYRDQTGSEVVLKMDNIALDTKLDLELFDVKKVIPRGTEYINKKESQ